MAIAEKESNAGVIWAASMVSGRTFDPLVELSWGDRKCQLDLDEARGFALHVLEAAEAAESDAFVFRWLTRDIIGDVDDEKANFDLIIGEFKKFREERTKYILLNGGDEK